MLAHELSRLATRHQKRQSSSLREGELDMSADESALTTNVPAIPPRPAVGKIIKWVVAGLVAIAAIVFGIRYWRHAEMFVSTDNAYVNANMVEIAAQVSGPITKISVGDQQVVKAGDPLFEIDSRPFELALASAEAQLEMARQSTSQS